MRMRKIRDEADARACATATEASGRGLAGWARAEGIDGRSLPAWSPTEREFQNIAELRPNMLFAGRTEGAHRACVLLGIAATCRAVGVPTQAYLTWAFERLGTHRDVFGLDLPDMTPAAFKRTRAVA